MRRCRLGRMEKMDDKNQIIEILKALVPIVSSIIGLLPIAIKQNSFRKKRFLIFKDIRKEYLKDKVNGYYYFQSFLNIRLPKKEIDHILKSPDAFAIMKIIRVCQGNYEFDKNTFKSKLSKKKYALPMIRYFISAFVILYPILYIGDFLKIFGKWYIPLFLMLVGVFGPILWTSIVRIREISSVLFLERITMKQNKKE